MKFTHTPQTAEARDRILAAVPLDDRDHVGQLLDALLNNAYAKGAYDQAGAAPVSEEVEIFIKKCEGKR